MKEAMQHSWRGYVDYAWGSDELLPLSKTGTDSFCGTGATILDALDTLWCLIWTMHNLACAAEQENVPLHGCLPAAMCPTGRHASMSARRHSAPARGLHGR